MQPPVSEVRSWGLRWSLLAPIIVLGLIAIGGVRLADDYWGDRQFEFLARRRSEMVLEGIVRRIEERQRTQESFAQLLAASEGLADMVEAGDQVGLIRDLVPTQVRLGLERIIVHDDVDDELLRLGPGTESVSLRPLIRGSLAGMVQSMAAAGQNGLEVLASAPVKGHSGAAGVIVVGSTLSGTTLAEAKDYSGAQVVLFRGGSVVASTVQDPELLRFLGDHSRSHKVNGEAPNDLNDGLERFSFYAQTFPLGEDGTLVALVSTQDMVQAAYHRGALEWLGMLLLLFAMFAVGLKFTRDIARPLEDMVAATEELVRGNYELNPGRSRIRELNDLAAAFGYLAGRIKAQFSDLERAANTDFLSGLPNRRAFNSELARLLGEADRDGTRVSLMIIDLDNFKILNDREGHLAGDRVIRRVGRVLRDLLPIGSAFRLGGDEFGVLLAERDDAAAKTLAGELAASLAQGDGISVSVPKVGVSIGVAYFPDNAQNGEELLRAADEAMYQAKVGRRSSVEVYYSLLDRLKDCSGGRPAPDETLSVLKGLMWLLEAKDRYTHSHCGRVSEYVGALGQALGLEPSVGENLKWASHFHDIGKIDINFSVLNKRDALSDSDWEMIRQHPVWSCRLLQKAGFPPEVIDAALHHHERWDGRGYPDELAGESIPLLARMIAIADSFDAMVSERPYGKVLSREEALAELKRCAGTQFDPSLAAVFIRLQSEAESIAL